MDRQPTIQPKVKLVQKGLFGCLDQFGIEKAESINFVLVADSP
jgi:hypothetical protein